MCGQPSSHGGYETRYWPRGMTQHCRRWGWRMFFYSVLRSLSRWHDSTIFVPRPFSPTAAGPAPARPWAAGNKPGQSVWLPSAVQKSEQPTVSPAALRLNTGLRSLPPPVAFAPGKTIERWFQSLDESGCRSSCTGLPRHRPSTIILAQQPLRRAFAIFRIQRFKPFAYPPPLSRTTYFLYRISLQP